MSTKGAEEEVTTVTQTPRKHHVKLTVVVTKPLEVGGVFISMLQITSLKLWNNLPSCAISYSWADAFLQTTSMYFFVGLFLSLSFITSLPGGRYSSCK